MLLLAGFATRAAIAAEWAETGKLRASDPNALDLFGSSVAIHGEQMVVGAQWDDEAAGDAGAIYVFEWNGQAERFEAAKLTAPDAGGDWYLGVKVAIWGGTVAATAPGADPGGLGAVYVFERDADGAWRATAKLIAPDGSDFSSSVAISGETLVVGTEWEGIGFPDAGAAYVYERGAGGDGNWEPVAKLKASDGVNSDSFGTAVALDGHRLVVGARNQDEAAPNGGAAYVFERDADGEWTETAKLTAADAESSDGLGWSVAVDGETMVAGTFGDGQGSAYVFDRDAGGVWAEVKKLTGPPEFGSFGSAVGIDGDIIVVGDEYHPIDFGFGVAYVFERDHGGRGNWGQVAKLTAADHEMFDGFGNSVAISGDWIVAGCEGCDDGAFDAGAAYVFVRVEPRLSAAGACPGTVTLALAGATPSQPVALFWGTRAGSTPVPSGRCAGTELGLADPVVLSVRPAGPDGDLSLVRTLGAGVCDRLLQVLDGTTCQVSAVLELPTGD